MPITPYLRPQDTITQILRKTPTPSIVRRNPVVIGPQYLIQMYDGRELHKETFLAAGDSLAYNLTDGNALNLTDYLPHVDSAGLYGEGLNALVAEFAAGALERSGNTVDSLRVLEGNADNLAGTVSSLAAVLDNRPVKVGDVVEVTVTGSNPVRRTVVARLPRVTAAALPGDLVLTSAVTNLPTVAVADIDKVSGPADWTTETVVTAPADKFLVYGGKHLSSGTLKLGEEFTLATTATDGIAGTASFLVTAVTSGLSATIVSTDGGAGAFQLALDTVGYDGVAIKFSTSDGQVAEGETITFRVFPAFTTIDKSALITVGGAYTGTANRRYVLEVTTGATSLANAVFRVFDTTGTDVTQSAVTGVVAGVTTISLGALGLTVTLAETALNTGAKFYIDAVAASTSTTEFNGVKLSGPILSASSYADEPISVRIFQSYTGALDADNVATGEALTATTTSASYAAGLGLPNSSTGLATPGLAPFETGIGRVVLSYKAAVIPGATEGVIPVESASEMGDLVGEAHLENWLGRGVFEAFSGSQGRRVYALRTLDDSVASFEDALRKIKTADIYYALAVMTDSIDVKSLVIAHVEEMSNKYNKNFRRCYVGTDTPGEYTYWGLLPSGGLREGSLLDRVFTIKEEDRQYGALSNADIGSFINIPELGEANYEILDVYDDYQVLLDIDSGLTSVDSGFSLIRSDSAENTVRFLAEQAQVLNSRRCVNVWSDRPTVTGTSGNVAVPLKFVAAEIAGLRCALLPQQGLTMTEISSVTAAPAMYTKFTPDQLDAISASGNMVVTQDAAGGELFIRHQLTTRTQDGALAYEDNVGVIVDHFSYQVKDSFRSYIGRRNATRDTIEEIRIKLAELADNATRIDLVDADIGPMVIRFFDEDGVEGAVTVRIDGVLADHILTYVKLRVPLPLNGIDHYIDVESSTEL